MYNQDLFSIFETATVSFLSSFVNYFIIKTRLLHSRLSSAPLLCILRHKIIFSSKASSHDLSASHSPRMLPFIFSWYFYILSGLYWFTIDLLSSVHTHNLPALCFRPSAPGSLTRETELMREKKHNKYVKLSRESLKSVS